MAYKSPNDSILVIEAFSGCLYLDEFKSFRTYTTFGFDAFTVYIYIS